VSKAFTKEDDGAGIAPVESARKPNAPFRLTAEGARALARSEDPRVREALSYAEVVEPPRGAPERAAFGVYVHVRDEDDRERVYHLVSGEEHALVGEGCSVHSPIGAALLGARPGDIREVTTPRGTEELEVTGLSYD
jgi:transcription elongation GreA/GreB family factor